MWHCKTQHPRESGDNGYPAIMKKNPTAKAFQDLSEELARQVAIRNANFTQTEKVEIKTQ